MASAKPFMLGCLILTFLGFLPDRALYAQTVVELDNPSLEGNPAPSRVPPGWYVCSPRKGVVPDLHPGGFYQVVSEPRSGKSYVALVGVPNANPGSLGQRLSQPLVAGQCYELTLFAARSSDYVAALSTTREPVNFNQPLTIRLWAGNEACEHTQLLDESDPVLYPDWSLFRFVFEPRHAYTHLSIIPAYPQGKTPYPGNVLIDQLSALFPIDCQTGSYLITPDTLLPAPIGSQEAWEAYISQVAGCLEFVGETDSLRKGPYHWLDSQALLYGNVALHSLAIAMKYFPERILQIRVKGPNRRIRKGRKRTLRQYWKELGYSGKQLQVRSARRKNRSARPWIENRWVKVRLR